MEAIGGIERGREGDLGRERLGAREGKREGGRDIVMMMMMTMTIIPYHDHGGGGVGWDGCCCWRW